MCLSIKVNHPNLVLSEGAHLGYEWVVTHNDNGYRCGYVRVPLGHPWHSRCHNDVDVDVHGGLSFSDSGVACDKHGDDSAWWLGFDCAHRCDAQDPDLPAKYSGNYAFSGATVKTTAYVEAECRKLCEQAVEAER